MVTNVFFENYNNYAEQILVEDLIIESIKIYGHNVFYCPRTLVARDEIFREDSLSQYNSSYLIEMYVRNVEGFEGEGDFLSKFGIQIRDELTLTVARRTFNQEIAYVEGIDRPQEGDLIYLPLTKKVYVVKFVEHEPVFYQMGALQMYDLKCELFEYSSEDLNTGVPEIDHLESIYSLDVANTAVRNANGDLIISTTTGRPIVSNTYILDTDSDNLDFQNMADSFIDFSEMDPFSEGGVF